MFWGPSSKDLSSLCLWWSPATIPPSSLTAPARPLHSQPQSAGQPFSWFFEPDIPHPPATAGTRACHCDTTGSTTQHNAAQRTCPVVWFLICGPRVNVSIRSGHYALVLIESRFQRSRDPSWAVLEPSSRFKFRSSIFVSDRRSDSPSRCAICADTAMYVVHTCNRLTACFTYIRSLCG